MSIAPKEETQKIFDKLKTKTANKVRRLLQQHQVALSLHVVGYSLQRTDDASYRHASIVEVKLQHGRQFLLPSTSVWTAVRTTETLVFTSLL